VDRIVQGFLEKYRSVARMIFPKTARPGLAQSTRDTANFAVKKIGIMAHTFYMLYAPRNSVGDAT
jgi:hypothetical protein